MLNFILPAAVAIFMKAPSLQGHQINLTENNPAFLGHKLLIFLMSEIFSVDCYHPYCFVTVLISNEYYKKQVVEFLLNFWIDFGLY